MMFTLRLFLLCFCLLIVSNGQERTRGTAVVNMNKETLANRVEKVSNGLDKIVRHEETTIEKVETPFFTSGAIYRVAHLGKAHPMGFTVGVADPDFTVMLPLNPKGFMELKGKAGFRMPETAKGRLEYVLTFLRTTRSFSQKFQILNEFKEIELIPKPSDEQVKEYEALAKKYVDIVKAPQFVEESKVVVFAVKQQSLVQIELMIASNGDLSSADTVLESKLPIAFTY